MLKFDKPTASDSLKESRDKDSSLAAALKTAVFNQVLSESPAVAGFIVGPAKVRAILQPERIQYLVGLRPSPCATCRKRSASFPPMTVESSFNYGPFSPLCDRACSAQHTVYESVPSSAELQTEEATSVPSTTSARPSQKIRTT